MKTESPRSVHRAFDVRSAVRNPFGVMDVPGPSDHEVKEFAAGARLSGLVDDDNAKDWCGEAENKSRHETITGHWSSRWNGGADPTIPGDTASTWKQGRSELRLDADRAFIMFDWSGGARKGLIEARRDGDQKLIGKYINLTDPKITRPWVGLIVSPYRIDGRWSGGRLDFRR